MTEIRVPTLGESVTEATIGKWFKKPGDAVAVDEPLVELETDKVTIEVPAPAAGVLAEIAAKDGETVAVGALLGQIKEGAGAAGRKPAAAAPAAAAASRAEPPQPAPAAAPSGRHAARAVGAQARGRDRHRSVGRPRHRQGRPRHQGRHAGRDRARRRRSRRRCRRPAAAVQVRAPSPADDAAREERVKMTRLRQTIARRLKEAQNTAAMLTTFNEVDMSAVMALRNQYKDLFEKKHGVKLGFMGFFVRACVQALKEIPAVNAEIDGTDLDLQELLPHRRRGRHREGPGRAGGARLPISKSLAEIEKKIADFGRRARDGALKIEEMQGGTFTITNGGVYGSLMSTPILNAPQSGILGMHKIQERPMVVAGKIEARPMMYLALSYDHRIVDGREAVTFLVRVKECLEDPAGWCWICEARAEMRATNPTACHRRRELEAVR